jgi:hypothetical protein
MTTSSERYDPLRLRVIWNNQPPVTPFMGFRDLFINPEPEYPFGRKGLAFMRAWEEIGIPNECVGILLLDGDVAVDPYDVEQMHVHLYSDVNSVWVAPIRIWPVSHLGANWVWGHGEDEFSQENVTNPNCFSFSFTYLPADLVNAMIVNRLEDWCYPMVDYQTHQLACELDCKVQVAHNCSPKHLHF